MQFVRSEVLYFIWIKKDVRSVDSIVAVLSKTWMSWKRPGACSFLSHQLNDFHVIMRQMMSNSAR